MGGYDLGFLDYRGSYALVGHPGDQKPSYVTQVQSKSGQGPSVISMTVPLTISRLYNCYTTFVRKKFKLSLCDTFVCSRISIRFLDLIRPPLFFRMNVSATYRFSLTKRH